MSREQTFAVKLLRFKTVEQQATIYVLAKDEREAYKAACEASEETEFVEYLEWEGTDTPVLSTHCCPLQSSIQLVGDSTIIQP
jgi:hypothetical protein